SRCGRGIAGAAPPRRARSWRRGRPPRARASDSPRKGPLPEAPKRSLVAPRTSKAHRPLREGFASDPRLEAETRPEGPRLEGRDEMIGQRVRKRKSVVMTVPEWQPSEARDESPRAQRDGAQAHLIAVQSPHLAAQVGQSIDQAQFQCFDCRPKGAREQLL